MNLQLHASRRNNSAFTIVEIVVVVGLVAMVLALAVPNLFKSRDEAQVKACIASLKAIDTAKQQWAVDKRKGHASIPTDEDLFGAGLYISVKPSCPSGGTYSLNAVNMRPACSISGHAP
jgi:competence protein ComGC